MHVFSENPEYVPGFLGYLMLDHQSHLANHKSKQVVGSLKHKKPCVFRDVKRLASKDESSESDDESSESDEEGSKSDEDVKTTPVENKNCKIRTFVSHIQPLIIIDGAHLKGEFFGTMYLAVAMDGYQQMHVFSENPEYVPGFLGYFMLDHQSDLANHKSKQSSESDEGGSESDEDVKTTPVENKNCK
nr:hypothetical protein [Tanacetum cinerariifolium]